MANRVRQAFEGRSIFVTGNTGFKGSWLTKFLTRLGAKVTGYALPPATTPNMFDLTSAREELADQYFCDVRDRDALSTAIAAARPDLVIHLAAQALVRPSYADPLATWEINVMGTANVLDAVRLHGASAALVVTTDKCYENRDWPWGYRENDALGGHDPYSASKAGAELVVQSYQRSFFSSGGALLASARAGNVIGGGDWSPDRLVADIARAVTMGEPLVVRSPGATRPWQHVLDCLSGYVALSARLLDGDRTVATAYNFGPVQADNVSVAELLARLQMHWPELRWRIDDDESTTLHEANFLYLDSSKARQQLDWQPSLSLDVALAKTADWYRGVHADKASARALTETHLEEYISSMRK